jgi:hypothetical protein
MKKLGFGKKGSEGDDPNRSALFGSRSSKKSCQPLHHQIHMRKTINLQILTPS